MPTSSAMMSNDLQAGWRVRMSLAKQRIPGSRLPLQDDRPLGLPRLGELRLEFRASFR
jgi:hypothetical protein